MLSVQKVGPGGFICGKGNIKWLLSILSKGLLGGVWTVNSQLFPGFLQELLSPWAF